MAGVTTVRDSNHGIAFSTKPKELLGMGDSEDHTHDCQRARRQCEEEAKARVSLRSSTDEADGPDSRKMSQGAGGSFERSA